MSHGLGSVLIPLGLWGTLSCLLLSEGSSESPCRLPPTASPGEGLVSSWGVTAPPPCCGLWRRVPGKTSLELVMLPHLSQSSGPWNLRLRFDFETAGSRVAAPCPSFCVLTEYQPCKTSGPKHCYCVENKQYVSVLLLDINSQKSEFCGMVFLLAKSSFSDCSCFRVKLRA